MDPQGPSQPTPQSGYSHADNPATQTGSEQANAAAAKPATGGTTWANPPIDHRQAHDVPSTHSTPATSTSLGYGSTGPLEEKPIPASDRQRYSQNPQLEGEQMRAPGEGDVADAVRDKTSGGHGEQAGLMEDIEGKTRAHREELHERGLRTGAEIREADGGGKVGVAGNTTRKTAEGGQVDLGEALGGRGSGVVLAPDE